MDQVIETSDSIPRIFEGTLLKDMKTDTQHWQMLKNDTFGEMLFINGQHQSSSSDEHKYHEMFVHSLMVGCNDPVSVLVLGGAEGCLTREILRQPTVQRIVQVDWDGDLVNQFSTEGRHWNRGAQKDQRVHLFFQDALSFLQNTSETFDCIFIDLLDPDADTLEFLEILLKEAKAHLNPNGNLSINAGLVSSSPTPACALAESMKVLFQEPQYYRAAAKVFVPSYFGEWCFLMATNRMWAANLTDKMLPKNLQFFTLDKCQKAVRWSDEYPESLRWFWLKTQTEQERIQKLTTETARIETKVFEHHGC